MLYRQSVTGWCIVLMENPPISPKYWPFPSHFFMKFSWYVGIIVLIDSLASGNPLCHHITLDIEENNHHGLELWTTHATFLCSWRVGDFQCIDCHFVSGSHVNIQVSSQVITNFNKSGLFWVHSIRSELIFFLSFFLTVLA